MPTVLVPLAQGCEELEAVTIVDVLRRAGITVVTAGLNEQPVRASRGVVLVPDTHLDQVMERAFDMMVLPGGIPGSDHLNEDPRVHQLLKRLSKEGKYTAAICAAPKVLARAGLLEDKSATAYPGVLQPLQLSNTHLMDTAVVKDDKVITSRGPGTAMDFALTLVETLMGKKVREDVETGLVRDH